MKPSELRFVSANQLKYMEARGILGARGISLVACDIRIEEIQSKDRTKLVRSKAIAAFKQIGRPLFVEHTGLYLPYVSDLPGGLTQIFWDALQADRFSELFGRTSDPSVLAIATIGYVDGRTFHHFEGACRGRIVPEPRGPRDFQWDCVFQPEGETQTFAEMGPEKKNRISMRRKALDRFVTFLDGGQP